MRPSWKVKGRRARLLSKGHVTNSVWPLNSVRLQLVDLEQKPERAWPTSGRVPQSKICSAGSCRPIKSRGGLSKVPVLALRRKKSWQVVLGGFGLQGAKVLGYGRADGRGFTGLGDSDFKHAIS